MPLRVLTVRYKFGTLLTQVGKDRRKVTTRKENTLINYIFFFQFFLRLDFLFSK